MNLVLQLMAGVTMAGLAEGMALADRAGLQQKDVLEVLELTSLACPMMIEKSKGTLMEKMTPRLHFYDKPFYFFICKSLFNKILHSLLN
jgi:3-hydroxyisobutyrate dehydrogenase-like beta-hydroxyacid dehydrogenase